MSGFIMKDITGRKFGRLTVIRYLPVEERPNKTKAWLCKCDCGNEIITSTGKLTSNHTRSCGCLCVDFARNINLKYKHVSKRLYSVYKGMLSRCYDKKHREYHNYGGRGILVCDEWKSDYDTFAEWALKTGYDEKAKYGQCTLDREDVNKPYSPDNCRWITNQAQQNNRRDCIYATYNGETHTCMEWSKLLGMTYNKVHYHLKLGRSIQYILST